MHIKALETLIKTSSLKNNIKFLIEGEEEVGSPNLGKFVGEHKDMLKARYGYMIIFIMTGSNHLCKDSYWIGYRTSVYTTM